MTRSARRMNSHTTNSSERDKLKDSRTTKMTWSYLTTTLSSMIIDILIATLLSPTMKLPK